MSKKYLGAIAPSIMSRTLEYATMQQTPAPMPSGPALPIPSRQQLDMYNVNREGWEAITQSLYDSAAYAAAGALTLNFFNLPVGQGVGFGGGTKTLSDTNMTLAGQMPANQEFLIQSIEVQFQPTTPTVAAAMPASLDAAANAAQVIINDAYIFYRSGNLNLTIGSKSYCQEAPLMKFPPKAYFNLHAALASSTTADTKALKTGFATARGRPFLLKAPLRLVSNQNFGVSLNWPEGLQAIANPARVFVILDGVFYRRSQ